MSEDSGGVSRRGLVAAFGGAGIGSLVGVAYFGGFLGGGGGDGGASGPRQITATAPNDDGEASLAELRYLLGPIESREFTLDVTGFAYEDGVVDLSYRSGAADQSGYDRWRYHLNELGQVAWSYGQYVAANDPNLDWPPAGRTDTTSDGTATATATTSGTATEGGPTTVRTLSADEIDENRASRILATVENPYAVETGSETPAQPSSYGVERRWIGNWLAGAWTQRKLLTVIANSRVGTPGDA
jgi:hypothetical protein